MDGVLSENENQTSFIATSGVIYCNGLVLTPALSRRKAPNQPSVLNEQFDFLMQSHSQSVQQSLLSSSVCATELIGRFCQEVCQSFAIITSSATDRNVAVCMNLHPAFFPEVAVETLSPRCCSVCVCVSAK